MISEANGHESFTWNSGVNHCPILGSQKVLIGLMPEENLVLRPGWHKWDLHLGK